MTRTIVAAAAAATLLTASPALAGPDPFLGEIMMVGYNFCPINWTEANGQLLSISQNTALFSLYGTTFGGNGQTTFGLPDLQGRVAMHTGNGAGLPPATMGEQIGTPSTTLTVNQMPAHTHLLIGTTGDPDWTHPNNNTLGTSPTSAPRIYSDDIPNVPMNPGDIGVTGGSQPFGLYQPSLVIRFCVALQGIYPSRN